MKKKTIAYCRVSTDKQLDGSGIDQQRASIIAYAMAHGISIDEVVVEHETGTTENREAIQRILIEARAEKIQAIIVDRVDRLGRTLVTCEKLYEDFRAAAVQVIFTNANCDTSASGVLLRQIMGALAQYDRTSWLSRMTQCRKAAAARKGTTSGGRAPYGYIAAGGAKLDLDPATVNLVRRALVLDGLGQSLTQITNQLNSEGFRTRKGTQFYPQQVKRILGRKDFYQRKAVLQKTVQLEAGVIPSQPELNMLHVSQGPIMGTNSQRSIL